MSCRHSLKPGPCSQCTAVPVKSITIQSGAVYEDGIPTGRNIDNEPRRLTVRQRQKK